MQTHWHYSAQFDHEKTKIYKYFDRARVVPCTRKPFLLFTYVFCFRGVPQVSTKTTVVNFSVKQLGLEAQLLGIVVQKEQPSLEEQSSELTVKVSPRIFLAWLPYASHGR